MPNLIFIVAIAAVLMASRAEGREIYIANNCLFEVQIRVWIDEGDNFYRLERRQGAWLMTDPRTGSKMLLRFQYGD